MATDKLSNRKSKNIRLRFNAKSVQMALKALIFLCLAAAIIELFPRGNNLNYQFETGKPWGYDEVTAPFDFPVYKPQDEINAEKAENLKKFTPYFSIDTAMNREQISKMRSALQNEPLHIQTLLTAKFIKIYNKGIISASDFSRLNSEGNTQINCIYPNRVSKLLNINDLYTPKTAYEFIANANPLLNNTLKDYNLNLYIAENVKYDSVASESSKYELLKNLSLTAGLVQAGEKVVDRGEIVTPATAKVLNSLKMEYEKRNTASKQSLPEIFGEILLVAVFITLLLLYLYVFRPQIFDSFKNLLLIAVMILIIVAAAALILRYTSMSVYLVPFALLPIIIRVFFDSRTALFTHVITVLAVSLVVDNAFQFLVLQIAVGMTAVSNLKDLTQRSQLAQTAFFVFICYLITYIGLELISEATSITHIRLVPLVYFAVSGVLLLFAYILIYFLEKIFGLVSSVTLVELTNINSDFMINFAEKAPGTFQHTLQVSNLATEAAKAISANALLVRTGALYHDIGKMQHPEYFTENQAGGYNPLLAMENKEAAKLIINHVADGIQMGKKNRLPDQIINFIATHHGTSKTRYFYNSYLNSNPDLEPNTEAFSYSGPRPNTRETAILMMVDAVEARSHSLKEYTATAIEHLVEDMIDSQIADGQFKDAPISFLDVEKVKFILKEKIKSIYHTRIAYPEVKVTGNK